jgi:hypothetical protein
MAGDPHPGRLCHLTDTNDGNNPPDNGDVVELNNSAPVLVGVNATPYGWPTASVDPGCAPARPRTQRRPAQKEESPPSPLDTAPLLQERHYVTVESGQIVSLGPTAPMVTSCSGRAVPAA